MNRYALVMPDDAPTSVAITATMFVQMMACSGVEVRTLFSSKFEAATELVSQQCGSPAVSCEQRHMTKRPELTKIAKNYSDLKNASENAKLVATALVALIAGDDGKSPVDMLVGYWPEANATQQMLFTLAVDYGVAVVNLAIGDGVELWSTLERLK